MALASAVADHPTTAIMAQPAVGEYRWVCPVLGCTRYYKRTNDLNQSHFKIAHPEQTWNYRLAVPAFLTDIRNDPTYAASLGSLAAGPPVIAQNIVDMDLAGRGQREKKPTEKVKDTTVKKEEPASGQLVPPKYKLPDYDPKWFEQPKEIPKIYHHTKVNEKTGEKFDFYKLGPQ